MKTALFLMLLTSYAWSKPTVMVSYFDPFGGAKVNNSETVARLLEKSLNNRGAGFQLKTCALQTKFDVSFRELTDCLRDLPEKPVLVIGLGETGCDLKVELMGRNLDRTKGPDNAGIQRNNTPIVKNAPEAIGFTYPLDEMYCALSASERENVVVSNNAGSFVCNNTAFQTAWYEREIASGFMHVPSHNCRNLSQKNEKAVAILSAMIERAVIVLQDFSRLSPLPVMKQELEERRAEYRGKDKCKYDFYKRARAFDEKSFWDIFNLDARMN